MIDTRDLIEKRDLLKADIKFSMEHPDDEMALGAQGREVAEQEIAEIDELEEEIGSEFPYGVPLIAEHEFEDYAREFAEDIGAIGKDTQWPATHIDWKRASEELAMDFTLVEYESHSYYVRAS